MSNGQDILSRLTRKVDKTLKDGLAIFGAVGVGKSSLAAQFPSPQFITDSRDRGFADLVRNGLVEDTFDPIEAGDWDSLVAVTKALADPATPLDCETVVFENLGGFQAHLVEKFISSEVAKTGKPRDVVTAAFMGWGGAGYKTAANEFGSWFRTANSILERTNNEGKPMRVVYIGHQTLAKDKNVSGDPGEEFYRVDIDLHPELLKIFHRDCSNIAWVRQRPLVIKGANGGIGRALSDDIRELVMVASGSATSKNRWGITEPISMGKSPKEAFANLKTAIANAKARQVRASQTQTGEGK